MNIMNLINALPGAVAQGLIWGIMAIGVYITFRILDIADLTVETISPQQMKSLSYYLNNWDSIEFDDKRKAADIVITTIRATSDHVEIEWKI